MKFIVQLYDSGELFQQQDDKIVIEHSIYEFDQVFLNKQIRLSFQKQHPFILHYTNVISERFIIQMIHMLATLVSAPIALKIFNLEGQTEMRTPVIEETYVSPTDMKINLRQIKQPNNLLIKINRVSLVTINKFESLKSFTVDRRYKNFYNVISSIKNNETNLEVRGLPDFFVSSLKCQHDNYKSIMRLLEIYNTMRAGIKQNVARPDSAKYQDLQSDDDLRLLEHTQAGKYPPNKSFINCDSPGIQKDINDQLMLALNEAHIQIRQMREQSSKEQPVLVDANTQPEVFSVPAIGPESRGVSPPSEGQQPSKQGILKQDEIEHIQLQINQLQHPSLEDISKQPTDHDIFCEYQVDNAAVEQAVKQRLETEGARIAGLHSPVRQDIAPAQGAVPSNEGPSRNGAEVPAAQQTMLTESAAQCHAVEQRSSAAQTNPPTSMSWAFGPVQTVDTSHSQYGQPVLSPFRKLNISVKYNAELNEIEIVEDGGQHYSPQPTIQTPMQQPPVHGQVPAPPSVVMAQGTPRSAPHAVSEPAQVNSLVIQDSYSTYHGDDSYLELSKSNSASERPLPLGQPPLSNFRLHVPVLRSPQLPRPFYKTIDSKVDRNFFNEDSIDKTNMESYIFIQDVDQTLKKHECSVQQMNETIQRQNAYLQLQRDSDVNACWPAAKEDVNVQQKISSSSILQKRPPIDQNEQRVTAPQSGVKQGADQAIGKFSSPTQRESIAQRQDSGSVLRSQLQSIRSAIAIQRATE